MGPWAPSLVQLQGLAGQCSGHRLTSKHETPPAARTTPAFLVSPSFTCLEPPHLANLTLENASECLMQH